jgi:hypothetical protein
LKIPKNGYGVTCLFQRVFWAKIDVTLLLSVAYKKIGEMGVFLAAGSSKLGLEKGEISDALATMIQLCAFARIRLQTPSVDSSGLG